jgi:FkbM family methyltransferase
MIERTSSTEEAVAFLARAPGGHGEYEAQRRIAVEIVSADLPDSLIVATRAGVKMHIHPASDFVLSRAYLVDGMYEAATHAFLKHVLAPGDIYVDVGANIGAHAVPASRYVGELGAVIAIEPNPDMVQRLLANLRLNQLANVRVLQMAVSNEAGSFKLFVHPFNPGNAWLVEEQVASPQHLAALEQRILADPEAGLAPLPGRGVGVAAQRLQGERAYDVEAAPLSQLLSEHDCASVAAIKIDVEGAEMSVLASGECLWGQPNPPCAIVEYDGRVPGARERIFNFFADRGWRLFVCSVGEGGRPTFNSMAEPYIAAVLENLYAVPPSRLDFALRQCLVVPYPHARMRELYGAAAAGEGSVAIARAG